MEKNYIDNITEIIFKTPLWVQEVLLIDLKKHLEGRYNGAKASLIEREIYTAYIPELTFKGKKELETHEHTLEMNIYKCFAGIKEGKRIIDITLNNFWTLEETSSYIAFGIDNEYIKAPDILSITAAVYYIGGKIRLGEYIKRLKKIDIVQLDDVLRKQKQHNESSANETKKRIGECLIEMGYIAKNDIDSIICIKEDAQKRCVLPTSSNLATASSNSAHAAEKPSAANNDKELLAKIAKLTQENNLLKEKLRAIFNIQNKKQQ